MPLPAPTRRKAYDPVAYAKQMKEKREKAARLRAERKAKAAQNEAARAAREAERRDKFANLAKSNPFDSAPTNNNENNDESNKNTASTSASFGFKQQEQQAVRGGKENQSAGELNSRLESSVKGLMARLDALERQIQTQRSEFASSISRLEDAARTRDQKIADLLYENLTLKRDIQDLQNNNNISSKNNESKAGTATGSTGTGVTGTSSTSITTSTSRRSSSPPLKQRPSRAESPKKKITTPKRLSSSPRRAASPKRSSVRNSKYNSKYKSPKKSPAKAAAAFSLDDVPVGGSKPQQQNIGDIPVGGGGGGGAFGSGAPARVGMDLDDVPVGGGAAGAGGVPGVDPFAPSGAVQLKACKNCGRKFNVKALARHVKLKVCKKKKRKAFKNSVLGDELKGEAKQAKRDNRHANKKFEKMKKQEKNEKIPKWKLQRMQLREAMKAGKMLKEALASGKSLADLPPPTSSVPDSRVPCKNCGRKFNEDRIDKHLKICNKINKTKGKSKSPPRRTRSKGRTRVR